MEKQRRTAEAPPEPTTFGHHENKIETVKLRTGVEEAKGLVSIVVYALKRLYEDMPMVLYELAELTRDRNHVPFGRSGDDLVKLKLIERSVDDHILVGRDRNIYTMHDSIRNIVMAAIEGSGMDMVLRSPLQQSRNENQGDQTCLTASSDNT